MSGALDITAFIVDTAANDPAAKVYYGNAEPEGHAVVVGGQAVVVGGWAAYEATRREARWQANPALAAAEPRGRYGGRTYVTGQDAVESLLAARQTARQSDPLARAAPRLAAAVAKFNAAVLREGPTSLWDRLGIPSDAPVAVSTITPVEISQAAAETDLEALHRAAEDAAILASGYARDDELPGLRAPRPPRRTPAPPGPGGAPARQRRGGGKQIDRGARAGLGPPRDRRRGLPRRRGRRLRRGRGGPRARGGLEAGAFSN